MALRDRMAISAAPVFLRIGLGVTFLWAGLGKILTSFEVKGEDAAILASLGAEIGPGTPPEPVRIEAPAPPEVSRPAPPAESAPQIPPADSGKAPESPAEKQAEKGVRSLDGKKSNRPPALLRLADPPASPAAGPQYKAADFPEPRPVHRVHGIALAVWKAAHPDVDAEGRARMMLMPHWAGTARWPVYLAWACAVSETLGGTLILVGLFTRLSALAIAFNMAVACWLTVIGPAIQSGDTALGFLPRHPRFDTEAWKTPLWQLSLLTSALALFFTGPGGASLDSIIFSRDAEPQPKPKPAE